MSGRGVIVAGSGPKAHQRPRQLDGARVAHLCRMCLGPIERHGGDLIPEWFCCPTCSLASGLVRDLCACSINRAGVRLKCTKLDGEDGGPGEVVVVEAE
jgi:hypothetical protein